MAFSLCIKLYYIFNTYTFCISSASNRIIPAKDHASIQINLAEIDSSTGRITGNHKIFTISGAIRRMVCIYNYIDYSLNLNV